MEMNEIKSSDLLSSSLASSWSDPYLELNEQKTLTSLPEVYNEPLDLTPERIRSTEDIWIGDERFTFKSIPDPGLYQSYNTFPGKQFENEDGKAKYLSLVKESKIPPVRRIINSLSGNSLELQFYGLDSRQLKPLCEALKSNTSVQNLNLKGNTLSVDGLYHLGQMLRKNFCLRILNLQHCKIGPDGAEMLGNGLEICEYLTDLNLSYNELGDDGMEALALKLGYNISIKKLNLSHNNLTSKSGFFLAETLEENMTIEHLDLSWNQIGDEQGLKKFLFTTADQNESLRSLDLSWNNLEGDKVANIIKTFIGQHRSLQEFNLSHNKLETASENIKIAKGINASESLQVINLSYNRITGDTAFALLSNISNKTKLRILHLDNTWVKPEFEKLRRELQSQTGMKVVIEGVSGGFDVAAPDMQTLLLKRAHFLGYKPKKKKKDFGWFLLRLQKSGTLGPVNRVKFEKLVQEDEIKFDEGFVNELVKRFKDQNKKIDLNLMLEKYMLLYPDTALPVPKEKKKGRKNSPTGGKTKPLRGSQRKSISKKELGLPKTEESLKDVESSKTESVSPRKKESSKTEEIQSQNKDVTSPNFEGYILNNTNNGENSKKETTLIKETEEYDKQAQSEKELPDNEINNNKYSEIQENESPTPKNEITEVNEKTNNEETYTEAQDTEI